MSDPDISISFEVGDSDSCTGVVSVHLYDTGSEQDGRKLYDAQLVTSNNDNVPLYAQAKMVEVALLKFYQLGLNTHFGRLIGGDGE